MFKKDALQIIVFQTYGTPNHLYLRGRAIEDESINLEQKGLFGLFINSWKRFETDEIKHTAIKVTLPNGIILKTTTDGHGYFKIDETVNGLNLLANSKSWLSFKVSFDDVNIKRNIQNSNQFPGELLIPPDQASFGVISDIDDTIIHTGVVSMLKWKVLLNSIFKSAASRIPLEGAAEFYHKLHRGGTGKNTNPIFYVSHSPWNLYRYLEFFLKQNSFPKGPILLRSFKDIFRKKSGNRPQKYIEIVNILKTYPKLKFILIGDSGEHDPDIYMEVAETFPDRILAIYLRSVNHKKKMLRVSSLYREYKRIPVLLVENGEHALKHARKHNFIV
ncbi:phosphatase domain-containing protein [uncultured Algibacter sp.]|uniref:App1 family protein n=1 Tax=uncultured Algibacter sp. TaxID=298659 RepID=UPI0026057130|nr:phosphatase domain-containing protein [uncultured Algibacter sp.]